MEKFGIRHDVDFQLEILQLLGRLYKADAEEAARLRKLILDSVTGDAELLSKAKLIEKFIEDPPPTRQRSRDPRQLRGLLGERTCGHL